MNAFNLKIIGMTCASCAGRIERGLQKIDGVQTVSVNLATEHAHITASSHVTTNRLIQAVVEAGYQAASLNKLDALEKTQATPQPNHHHDTNVLIASCLLTLPLVVTMFGMVIGQDWLLPPMWQWLLATPVQFLIGYRFYRSAWFAIKAGSGNMDLLVAIGTSAAYGLSLFKLFTLNGWVQTSEEVYEHDLYFETSALVITLVLLGKWLESRAKTKTTQAIRALATLQPSTATVERDGQTLTIPIDQLQLNDTVLVHAGERVATDGVILEGITHVDESHITGESLPIEKYAGNKVVAGSINQDGLIKVKTTAVGQHTMLAQIIQLVEQAQTSKAPIQQLVDKMSAVFVPIVLVTALLTLLGWSLYNGNISNAVLNAVAVLVIACPCALGLATPTAMMVGTGVAATHGILIKDAQALEHTHALKAVVFDKTGTLTEGHPKVLGTQHTLANEADFIRLVAAVNGGSEHPLAQAIKAYANSVGVMNVALAANIKTLAGRGIQGVVGDTKLLIGNHRLVSEMNLSDTAFSANAQRWQNEGNTVSYVIEQTATQTHVIGVLAFGDTIKALAKEAIAQLHKQGIRTMLMSGDNEGATSHVANALGITTYYANILPSEKANKLNALRKEVNGLVAMVGDGVNDAPALAAADIGIAMGTGTDVAMHTASITLMRGNPTLVAKAIEISKKTYAKIRQNLFWAMVYNMIGIPMAALGLLNPVLAGAAMTLSSISVVFNALLLRRAGSSTDYSEATPHENVLIEK